MDKLDGWVIIWNPHRNMFCAAKRENYFELYNGDKGNVLYASTFTKLKKLIC